MYLSICVKCTSEFGVAFIELGWCCWSKRVPSAGWVCVSAGAIGHVRINLYKVLTTNK